MELYVTDQLPDKFYFIWKINVKIEYIKISSKFEFDVGIGFGVGIDIDSAAAAESPS